MKKNPLQFESAYYTLMRPLSPWNKSAEERAKMTIASKDGQDIPRVKNAGDVITKNGVLAQVMHNGLLVKKDGYQGGWQTKTIKELRGIHEPQEEKVFYEVLKRVKKGAKIMELGSWWSYYSMWFLKAIEGSKAYCCEPDPINIDLGRENMALNNFTEGERAEFIYCASGSRDGKMVSFETEAKTKVKVPMRSIDSLMKEKSINYLDILHMDIQGAELDTLKGAEESITAGKIRFIFISTHHYSISRDPLMHRKCIDFITSHGGTIIAKHSVLESSSGDGLIVGSFAGEDKGFEVHVTLQDQDDSLFRAYDKDLDILWRSYDDLLKASEGVVSELERLKIKYKQMSDKKTEIEKQLADISTLRRHVKRQARSQAGKIKRKIIH